MTLVETLKSVILWLHHTIFGRTQSSGLILGVLLISNQTMAQLSYSVHIIVEEHKFPSLKRKKNSVCESDYVSLFYSLSSLFSLLWVTAKIQKKKKLEWTAVEDSDLSRLHKVYRQRRHWCQVCMWACLKKCRDLLYL